VLQRSFPRMPTPPFGSRAFPTRSGNSSFLSEFSPPASLLRKCALLFFVLPIHAVARVPDQLSVFSFSSNRRFDLLCRAFSSGFPLSVSSFGFHDGLDNSLSTRGSDSPSFFSSTSGRPQMYCNFHFVSRSVHFRCRPLGFFLPESFPFQLYSLP